MVFDQLSEFGDSPAVVFGDTALTYCELVNEADGWASNLKQGGLVFILPSNDLGSVIGYVGALRSRTVVALINPETNLASLEHLVSVYRPQYIWTKRHVDDAVPEFDIVHSKFDYQLYSISRHAFLNPVPEQLALLLQTSGTTGSPKMVRLTCANIASNTNSIVQSLQMCGSDRAITTLPFHYSYGLSLINTHLVVGGSIVLSQQSLVNRLFWELIEEHDVTNFGGVPFTFKILKTLGDPFLNSKSLRFVTQAGGRLAQDRVIDLYQSCANAGKQFYVMYGQTEASPRMSIIGGNDLSQRPSSVGRPLQGCCFYIKDSHGNPVTQSGTVGNLFFSGPNVALGYAVKREDLTVGDDFCGHLDTGDRAYLDEEGFCFLVGRNSRFAKLYGHRLNLDDIENEISAQGIDIACTVVNEVLIVATSDKSSVDDLLSKIVSEFKLHRSAVKIQVYSHLPRLDSGKVDYKAIAKDSQL